MVIDIIVLTKVYIGMCVIIQKFILFNFNKKKIIDLTKIQKLLKKNRNEILIPEAYYWKVVYHFHF